MRECFDQWEESILSVLPGATKEYAELNFWNVARTFYRRSRAWREAIGPMTLRAGVSEYPINPVDQNADVCFLEAAKLKSVPLFMRVGHSHALFAEGHTAEGTPQRVELITPHMMSVYPTPVATHADEMVVIVSCAPKRGSEALPAHASTHHFEALESGVLGRLLMNKNQPWHDPAAAIMHQRRFEIEVARARANAEKGYTKNATDWRYHNVGIM